jgi:hypothetical protein
MASLAVAPGGWPSVRSVVGVSLPPVRKERTLIVEVFLSSSAGEDARPAEIHILTELQSLRPHPSLGRFPD